MKGRRLAPRPWQANLFIFGLLISAALLFALYQSQQLRHTLASHIEERRQLLGENIRRYLALGAQAESSLSATTEIFLDNSARFIDYLQGVEPLSAEELAGFAAENNLSGIAIFSSEALLVTGPVDWLATGGCLPLGLRQSPDSRHYLFSRMREGGGCVLLGFPARRLADLRRHFSRSALWQFISDQPGVRYLEPASRPVRLQPGVGEAEIRVAGERLRVGFDIAPYEQGRARVWHNFLLFALLLSLLGLFLSWLLFRIQGRHVAEISRYEQEMARQQEAAALGRSAAAIAHEIRNPLNAMGMGLQRLAGEVQGLEPEARQLLDAMGEAVARTNGIVADLQRFATPLTIRPQNLDFAALLRQQLLLRQAQAEAQGVAVALELAGDLEMEGDRQLLALLLDNLLKNSLEAQPQGGFLAISAAWRQGCLEFTVENGGFDQQDNIGRLAEPYFTRKSQGSGLGLATCAKIVAAHGGELTFHLARPEVLQVRVRLPARSGNSRCEP